MPDLEEPQEMSSVIITITIIIRIWLGVVGKDDRGRRGPTR